MALGQLDDGIGDTIVEVNAMCAENALALLRNQETPLGKRQNLSPKRAFCHPYRYEHSHETAGDEWIRSALTELSIFSNFLTRHGWSGAENLLC